MAIVAAAYECHECSVHYPRCDCDCRGRLFAVVCLSLAVGSEAPGSRLRAGGGCDGQASQGGEREVKGGPNDFAVFSVFTIFPSPCHVRLALCRWIGSWRELDGCWSSRRTAESRWFNRFVALHGVTAASPSVTKTDVFVCGFLGFFFCLTLAPTPRWRDCAVSCCGRRGRRRSSRGLDWRLSSPARCRMATTSTGRRVEVDRERQVLDVGPSQQTGGGVLGLQILARGTSSFFSSSFQIARWFKSENVNRAKTPFF